MPILRIHFTGADLVRLHLADTPDPLWETVLSLQILKARYAPIFHAWRRRTRDALRQTGQIGQTRAVLSPLTPDTSYFPDFLTPAEGLLSLPAGLDAIRHTPVHRVRHEVRRLAFPASVPPEVKRLADGDRDLLAELGGALAGYHRAAIAPYWEAMKRGVEVEHARRALHRRAGGPAGLLAGFGPGMRWRPPVLEMPYAVDRDLHLDGRGLLLIPSYFCWYHPVALADSGLPPAIVYPLRPTADLIHHCPATAAEPALDRLVGPTRARVLHGTAAGASTSELARRAGVAPTTASQHAAVLRDAGLIRSERDANTVIHTLTPLGAALLGATPPS
ncbi:helix-turn-helix domain-containing protein [Actinomycetes bacterium KLBMP 9797]